MKNKNAKSTGLTITAGNWSLNRWGKEIKGHPTDAAHEVVAHDGRLGATVCFLPVSSEIYEHGTRKKRVISPGESLANGRLLAAAPELFRALVATWIIVEGTPDILNHIGHCRNKADGKTLHETVRKLIDEVAGKT